MGRIKIGILTNHPEPLNGFDLTTYYVKSCTGKINKPAPNFINIISCFGDNQTARKRPEWVAVSNSEKATRTNKSHHFLWDHICPNVDEYKFMLFDLITETLNTQVAGIHLDCIGFPRTEYCTCPRCCEAQKEKNLEWTEWRSKVVTDFISEASKLVKENGKSFSVTLLPDPCFGKERYGEDFRSLSKYVDFFIVPMYDLVYSTTYWLETLAIDFCNQLEKPLFVELYAANPGPKLKNLLAAMIAISDYAEGIILATHDTVRAKKIQEILSRNSNFIAIQKKQGCETIIGVIKDWKAKTP